MQIELCEEVSEGKQTVLQSHVKWSSCPYTPTGPAAVRSPDQQVPVTARQAAEPRVLISLLAP